MDLPTPLTGPDIRARRRHLGLPQKDLAHLLGCHPLTLAAWEQGRSHPRPDTLAQLRHLLLTLSPVPRARQRAVPEPGPLRLTAEQIRTCRTRCGLSRRELGERIGVKGNTICWWEHGRSIPGRSANLLMRQLFNIDQQGDVLKQTHLGVTRPPKRLSPSQPQPQPLQQRQPQPHPPQPELP